MENIGQQFKNLIDPSTALGAFLISIFASFVGGFFTSNKMKKKNIQKARDVDGDMIQDSTVDRR
jgi:ABC-type antimicrobial peptide transport system permease subunit